MRSSGTPKLKRCSPSWWAAITHLEPSSHRSVRAKDVVFKSDQERAIVGVLNEVLRVSKLTGDHRFRYLNSAVPEKSAVGESQSNSRAERSVQQIEDVVRTSKSAIES